jgi:hypothetical protein
MSVDAGLRSAEPKLSFLQELSKQRWDDHRFYHHSRINQSLHLLSSICFMTTYVLLAVDPGVAALLGWLVAMWSRQIGHFFFEPKDYDEVNRASHEYKEKIKIGYNLNRKRVLLSIWAVSPLLLHFRPDAFGLLEPHSNGAEFLQSLTILWLWLAVGALLFRTVHLFWLYNLQTGLVWATKILTDPFNDFCIYIKAPLYVARGELIDPMLHIRLGFNGEESAKEEIETQPAMR